LDGVLVRISGFTTWFVELTDRMQEEIIARTEFGVG
jgi:pyruvate-formate lyase